MVVYVLWEHTTWVRFPALRPVQCHAMWISETLKQGILNVNERSITFNLTSMQKIARLLVVIGGLNWGLVGLGGLMGGNWNVVNMLLGSMPMVEAIVYLLVGIATVLTLMPKKQMPMA